MNCCTLNAEGIATPRAAQPDLEPLPGLDQRTRHRQWAVTYLEAAAKAISAGERSRLRRQAAELILPRGAGGSGAVSRVREAC